MAVDPFGNPVGEIQIFNVKVVRWWRSREIWNYIAGLVLTVAPIVADNIGGLGLSPMALLVWSIGVQIATHSAGFYFKMTSTKVIGGAADVSVAGN